MTRPASPDATQAQPALDAEPEVDGSAPGPRDPFGVAFLLEHQHPDLRSVRTTDWLPALLAGIAEERDELEEIAAVDAEPEVANTLQAIGRAGRRLRRVQRAFGCVVSADATDALQAVQTEIAPELAAHRDWTQLHPGIHRRLRRLLTRIEAGETRATAEQRRMLDQLLTQCEAAGAGLDAQAQDRLRELNRRLAEEETAYQRLQRREAAQAALLIEDPGTLAGLDHAALAASAAAAAEAGSPGGHLLRLTMPVQQPLLKDLHDRNTRRRLHLASLSRGSLRGEDGRTTRQIGAEIAVLRARRAHLLGHPHHLDAVLPLRTAPDRTRIEEMLRPLAADGLRRLQEELRTVERHLRDAGELGDQEEDGLQPWDVSYGLAAVERSRSVTEDATTSSRLPLEEALSRVFEAARRVYGVSMIERPDLPGFVEGARTFEVRDHEETVIGLYLLDLHSRPTKAGGAWMNSFSVASALTGSRPVVINCLNVAPPAADEAARLSRDEQRTLFHEFGHALHGLLAEAEFEELSGTAVPRDNVEFPSQVNEVFAELWTEDTESAEDLGSRHWGRGMKTVEHVAAVVLDLAWHTLGPEEAEAAAADPEAFEQRALADWGLDHPLVPPRYGTGFFKHIFAGSGYAAGYYSYLWAEVLAADAADWFRTVLDDEQALARAGTHFRRELLSRGNTRGPEESFRAAIGREPSVGPLLRSLGMQDQPREGGQQGAGGPEAGAQARD